MIHAWVDPVFGVDGLGVISQGSPYGFFPQVDDATAPFKTIQHAIDAVESHVITAFTAGAPQVQGIVYALPGLYGPAGNGEVFPIVMRDRVHLQGQGARGTVIRGDGLNFTPTDYFYPGFAVQPSPLVGVATGEVLVEYSRSSKFATVFGSLPWNAGEETAEMLDGFTLQGGEVQVNFYRTLGGATQAADELRGRISNCLFDMRHNWTVHAAEGPITVSGPFFGIEMAKLWVLGPNSNRGGYPDHKVVIVNNTFLMVDLRAEGEQLYLESVSRDNAVALIDVTDSGCFSGFTQTDPDVNPRGLGNVIVANNLFRTPPTVGPSSAAFAMLGIDVDDTSVSTVGMGGPVPSNAFAPQRVGNSGNNHSNGYFQSTQVTGTLVFAGGPTNSPLFDCHGMPPSATCNTGPATCCPPPIPPTQCTASGTPTNAVEVFDLMVVPTGSGMDPVFVGEYLAPGLNPGAPRYRDWRVLPGSPMIDTGIKPVSPGTGFGAVLSTAGTSGWTYMEPSCPELHSFDWDHEGYGNPRTVGASTDIGFDEFHLFIMAGNYANDSNSHNVSGFLNPTPEPGRPQRTMILSPLSGGATQVRIHGTNGNVQIPRPSPSAWSQPPRTTSVIDTTLGLPVGFKTRWISFLDNPATGTPTPWDSTSTSVVWTGTVNYPVPWTTQVVQFATLVVPADNEPSGPPNNPTAYFGSQAVGHAGQPDQSPFFWSNLQYEYR